MFIAESLCEKGVEEASARVVFVESRDAWHWAAAAQVRRPLVLVPTFPGFDLGSSSGIQASVVVPFGPEATLSGYDCINIPSLPFPPVIQILVEEGMDEVAARQLVERSGAKLGAMQRLRGYVVEPAWSNSARLPESIALLLLGAFCPANEADVAVVRGIGVDPSNLESLCQALSAEAGRPVESVQDGFGGARCWRWTSPGEAWEVLAPKIGRAQFEVFSQTVLDVLGANDPCYSLPPEKRVYARVLREVLPHSEELRSGLAHSIAWLSLSDSALTPALGPGAGSIAAQGFVRRLLGVDWIRWASLSDLLPVLAEAAPTKFLDALEASLAIGESGVSRLLREEGPGMLSGPSPHTGVLWALETLAWSRPHASRSAMVLARLAANDPPGEGKLANRPDRSLAALLNPGVPQSGTSADERIEIMETLVRREPEIAWKIMFGGIRSSSHSNTRRPKIVAWDLPPMLAPSSAPEYHAQIRGWVALMLSMCDGHPDRLAKLVEVTRMLPPDLQAKVFERIEGIVPLKDSADPNGGIWAALRRELWILEHMRDNEKMRDYSAHVQSLYSALSPSEVAVAVAWLFIHDLVYVTKEDATDISGVRIRSAERRAGAIELVRRQPEPLGLLLRLCDLGADPAIVGDALARSEWAAELVSRTDVLQSGIPLAIVPSLLVAYASKAGTEWLVAQLQAIAASGRMDLVLATLRLLPVVRSTWRIVEGMGSDFRREYWKTISHPYGGRTPEEGQLAISALLEVGRPGAALSLAGSSVISLVTMLRTRSSKCLCWQQGARRPSRRRDRGPQCRRERGGGRNRAGRRTFGSIRNCGQDQLQPNCHQRAARPAEVT